jgi:epsilon-lactone hydrolase
LAVPPTTYFHHGLLASPLNGDLTGLPAIRVYVGDDEVLLDDSRRYVQRAVAVGVDARLDVWMGMAHGFVNGVGTLQAATETVSAMGNFLNERLGGRVRRPQETERDS